MLYLTDYNDKGNEFLHELFENSQLNELLDVIQFILLNNFSLVLYFIVVSFKLYDKINEANLKPSRFDFDSFNTYYEVTFVTFLF